VQVEKEKTGIKLGHMLANSRKSGKSLEKYQVKYTP
jgi:hypothetical protein